MIKPTEPSGQQIHSHKDIFKPTPKQQTPKDRPKWVKRAPKPHERHASTHRHMYFSPQKTAGVERKVKECQLINAD
jgi:hypothetical protein